MKPLTAALMLGWTCFVYLHPTYPQPDHLKRRAFVQYQTVDTWDINGCGGSLRIQHEDLAGGTTSLVEFPPGSWTHVDCDFVPIPPAAPAGTPAL